MKYYVVADVHGFGTLLKNTLKEKGFFDDKEKHKLIVLGDLMDRGKEACELQDFILDLLKKDELIFVRGNHEDLMLDMLDNFSQYKMEILWGGSHHVHNGTFDTALQISKMQDVEILHRQGEFMSRMKSSPFIKELIPKSIDYFETSRYIFVHGWIPCQSSGFKQYPIKYEKIPNWRKADRRAWEVARWTNGMDAAYQGATIRGKTIVCGHYHCSYGHAKYERKGSEYNQNADYSPYIAKGIIAIDACTVVSHQINCLVIYD